MSAGICIMNRQAIALAADSAVTVGNHAAIHNSANKLFSLSRLSPVGLIIYANASLMTVPVEIIVKQYKQQLGCKSFSSLKEYVDDFIGFIEQNSKLLRFDINERDYVVNVFLNLMAGFLSDYDDIKKRKYGSYDKTLTCQELYELEKEAVDGTVSYVKAQQKRSDYDFSQYIKSKYFLTFIDILKNDEKLKVLSEEGIRRICEVSCDLFDTNFDRNGYVGVAIAGYGDSEIYPHMYHLHVSGSINGKLRFYEQEHVEISESTGASVIPLAQTDVMQTFLFGINDGFLNDLAKELPKQIHTTLEMIDDNCFTPGSKKTILSQMNSMTSQVVKHIAETASRNYLLPIIQSVASLPIEELSLLAESMINITSLRRKVALDRNIGTVGGPIDVAIISKGDGFIWLKRKHYFDAKYNPQYYYSHFEKLEKWSLNDE